MMKSRNKKIETPDLMKLTTSNKKKKTQQQQQEEQEQHENSTASVQNAVAATTITITSTNTNTKRANKNSHIMTKDTGEQQKKEKEESLVKKLRFGSTTQDSIDDEDFEDDDEEAEESETDLLDDDDDDDDEDDVDEEATLLISSDEEEFLETQRISLPELIVKKLLHTTTTGPTTTTISASTSTSLASAGTKIINENDKVDVKTKQINQRSAASLTKQKNATTIQLEVKGQIIESNVKKKLENTIEIPMHQKCETQTRDLKICDDFPKPMLLPKMEKNNDDLKQTTQSTLSEPIELNCSSKRRRGRPPKSKLTEANVQVKNATDKPPKHNRSAILPTSSKNEKLTVFGRISYYAPEQSLIYQCTLCDILFCNEFNSYAQHLRESHQVLKYVEDPIMVLIQPRKMRTQQNVQQKSNDVHDPTAKTGLKVESPEPGEHEQPKDDKENLLSQLNKQNIELSREPYFACGLVTLYDPGTLNLTCKYCDSSHTHEEHFKKHILLEHHTLITPVDVSERIDTPSSPATATDEDINDISNAILKPSDMLSLKKQLIEKCSLLGNMNSSELLTIPKALETPPLEEEDQQESKRKNHNVVKETVLGKVMLQSTVDDVEAETLQENTKGKPQMTKAKDIQKHLVKKTTAMARKSRYNEDEEYTEPIAKKNKNEHNELVGKESRTVKSDEGKSVQTIEEHPHELQEQKITGESIIHTDDALQQKGKISVENSKLFQRKRKRISSNPDTETEVPVEIDIKRPERRSEKRSSQSTRRNKNVRNQSKPSKISSPPSISSTNVNQQQLQENKHVGSMETVIEPILPLSSTAETKSIISNEVTIIATSLSTNKQRKRRSVGKRSKQFSSPEEAEQYSDAIASTQLHEKQYEMQQMESTPLTPLPPEITVSDNLARKRQRNAKKRVTDKQAENSKETRKKDNNKETKEEKKNDEDGEENKEDKTEKKKQNEKNEQKDDHVNGNKGAPTNEASSQSFKTLLKKKRTKDGFVCEICNKAFKKWSRLIEHMRLHTGEMPFKCDKCDKKFRIKARLTDHMLRHLGNRKFKCNICNISMATRQDLSQHQRYHSGERPHTCPHCPKAFVRSSDLKIHLRIHTGEKPFACDICHQRFRANQNLYVHKKSHLGVKDYKCELCGKDFRRKIDKRVHMRTHTGEKPYICEICGRGFSSKYNVRTHIERFHMNSGGNSLKKERKPSALRIELERQKELIEELRNQLAQHIKTEEVSTQQQLQPEKVSVLPPASTTESLNTSENIVINNAIQEIVHQSTSKKSINDCQEEQPISLENLELPQPMHGMPTAVHMPINRTKKAKTISTTNSIGALSYSSSSLSSSTSLSTLTPSPKSQIQQQKEQQPLSTNTENDAALNPASPQPHDISILAVFTTQPRENVSINDLPSNSIQATTTPLCLQLPTTDRTSSQKKERKITSYFNVMDQKS